MSSFSYLYLFLLQRLIGLGLQTRERNAKQGKRASKCDIKKKNAKSQREIEMKQAPCSEKETSNLLGLYVYLELINVMIFCFMQ